MIHYEFGKAIQMKKFERTRHLSALPSFLPVALNNALRMEQMMAKNARLRSSTSVPMLS